MFGIIVISKFLFHILQVFRLDFNNWINKFWFVVIINACDEFSFVFIVIIFFDLRV